MAEQSSELSPRKQPIFNVPAVVTAVVGAWFSIHLVLQLLGDDWRVWSLYAFAFIPQRLWGDPFPAIPGSQVWSFLTYAFLHADWMHLLFNSLWFVVFGSVVARRLGALRFLILASITAVAGALASLLLHWGEGAIVIGGSAAVSGALAAAIPIMYGEVGRTMGVAYIVPLRPGELLSDRRALVFMLFWLAITLFSGATGWTGNGFADDFSVAWEAHLGGFAAGLAAFYMLDRDVTGLR
jgi:membrane associated rhomboid family serine protease